MLTIEKFNMDFYGTSEGVEGDGALVAGFLDIRQSPTAEI